MIFNLFNPSHKLQKKEIEIELEIQEIINFWNKNKSLPAKGKLEKFINERSEILTSNNGKLQNIFQHTFQQNLSTIQFNRIKQNENWRFKLIRSNLDLEIIDDISKINKEKYVVNDTEYLFKPIESPKELGNVKYSLRSIPPEISENWQSIFSEDFKKCLKTIDKKLKGRILEAVLQISENPTTLQGDTVKPLKHEFSGCWRYRIGDYRLIYKPIKEVFKILFLEFGSRGEIYE